MKRRNFLAMIPLVALVCCKPKSKGTFEPYVPEEDPKGVKMFGAVGDGITDDTDAIQRAIDAGVAIFPRGTYLIRANTLKLPMNIIYKTHKK